ncbi:MAG TPA: hypothetical protein ENN03_11270 [bacterium]|nr:hypothetical protein [bacterium]
MTHQLCVFEDNRIHGLLPLTWTRPVYWLRTGLETIEARLRRCYPSALPVRLCRPELQDYVREQDDIPVNRIQEMPTLFLNGRLLISKNLARQLTLTGDERVFFHEDQLVAVRTKHPARVVERLGYDEKDFAGWKRSDVKAVMISYAWDLIKAVGELLSHTDFPKRGWNPLKPADYPGTWETGSRCWIHKNTILSPGVVLDSRQGPVWLDDKVEIEPHSYIRGPVYIGRGTRLKAGIRLSHAVIGPECKLGGEVEDTIIQGFSNKQHEGFLGHAYLGEWVNLGAGTNNSDLKNNYSPVRVVIQGRSVDTGLLFMGLIMGDHSKSGINTMFNTGTVAGVGCNVFGAGFPSKFIPSFSWGGAQGWMETDFNKFVESARKAMGRRNVLLSKAGEALLRYVYERSAAIRLQYGVLPAVSSEGKLSGQGS